MRFLLFVAILSIVVACTESREGAAEGGPKGAIDSAVIGNLAVTDVCIKDSILRSGRSDKVTVKCDLQPAEIRITAVDPSGIVVFAEMDCECDENNQNCESCRCQSSSEAEIERSCLSFITWCVDNDYSVNGNIRDATCTFD